MNVVQVFMLIYCGMCLAVGLAAILIGHRRPIKPPMSREKFNSLEPYWIHPECSRKQRGTKVCPHCNGKGEVPDMTPPTEKDAMNV